MMSLRKLHLTLLEETLAVCRMSQDAAIPSFTLNDSFFSITRTRDELSIVCQADQTPSGANVDSGWRCFKIEGPFEFTEIGVLASVIDPLRSALLSVFAISTYDTDYLLVKEADVGRARETLTMAGHLVGPKT